MNLKKCKHLSEVIKAQQRPLWPTLPTTDLPPKDLADTLVNIYLRTIETIYRVLHIPTFRREYDAFWLSGMTPDADMAFAIQLKLVLAIGAVMYDDHFTLRSSAIQWIYEAQTWISEPDSKARLGIQFLQSSILLLLAQEIVGIDGGLSWISVGGLFRKAAYMGLHRDPLYLPKSTKFVSEMRRRLWSTIVEISLQSSLESGAPPLFSLNDFDTDPPGNFDDDQIVSEDPMPKPEETFTQMSIALALRKTFQFRLSITELLNGLGTHHSYEEILRLDSELRKSYRTVCRTLQGHRFTSEKSPSQFETRALDFIIHRYFLVLHMPHFGASRHETTYTFSRNVVVEASLKAWYTVCPVSSIIAAPACDETTVQRQNDLTRFAKCGSGLFRINSMQACFLVAAEVMTQLQEEDSLVPVPLRHDLISVLEDGKKWAFECLEAGETDTKDYLFLSLVSTLISGLICGLSKVQITELLAQNAEEVGRNCLTLFEGIVGEIHDDVEVNMEEMGDMPSGPFPAWMGSWGFMVSLAHTPNEIHVRVYLLTLASDS